LTNKVGLTLNVKVDRIDDNGFVSLSVAPAVSAPIASQNTGAGQIVLVSERSLTSGVIRLRDGQTLFLAVSSKTKIEQLFPNFLFWVIFHSWFTV
jgi:type II secretory pathway component HofQ